MAIELEFIFIPPPPPPEGPDDSNRLPLDSYWSLTFESFLELNLFPSCLLAKSDLLRDDGLRL